MESIAIIGTGIAGMGCGHFLHRHYKIDLYEQNDYAGGHTNTVDVEMDGNLLPIDTGFIVFNYKTYPNLVRLFKQLDVKVKPTNMSFGVQHIPSGLEYGSQDLFAQKGNYFSPRFWKLLFQIQRFYKEAEEVLSDDRYQTYSLKNFIQEKRYSSDFVHQYIVPMSSALWSTPVEVTLQYPVRVLVNFFKNHGLLGINAPFQWYTVDQGSRQYRNKLIAPFADRILLNCKVKLVTREEGKAVVHTGKGSKVYDKVIFATHADQALALLGDPSRLESQLLLPFTYQKNVAKLHTDESVMPNKRSTWSAWNYRVQDIDGNLTATTIYDMNILQQISEKKNYFVSINDPGLVDEFKVIRTVLYEHPVFTPQTAAAQEQLHQLNQNDVSYFCGSYFGFGFHEDAFASAVKACEIILGFDVWESEKTTKPEEVLVA